MKISSIVIGLFIVAMIITGFTVYYVDVSTKYVVNYDNSSLQGMNKYGQLQNITEQVNSRVGNQSTESTGFGIIGDFLSYGYYTLKATVTSIDLFGEVVDSGVSNIPADDQGTIMTFKNILFFIVMLLFLFALIAVLVNRPQL